MNLSRIIMVVMAFFFVLGAGDRLLGNKFGLGAEFERAFSLMGPTALSVLGLMCLAPVLSDKLYFILAPLFRLIGAEPCMFPGVLLSCDIGYPMALEMAEDPNVGLFSGLLVGSVMGFVVSFTIPLGCGMLKKEDHRTFATGVLAGYILDPVACFIGGLAMGIPAKTVLINLVPVIVVAGIIVAGLLLAPNGTLRIFMWLSRFLMAIIMIGLAAAAVQAMTGLVIIPGMTPISEGFKTIGTITLALGGSLPMLCLLQRYFGKALGRIGARIGVNDYTMLYLLIGTTSLVTGYTSYDKMNQKGKVMFSAFSASAGSMLGCHIGVTNAVAPEVVVPLLIAKCLAGAFALVSAYFFAKRMQLED